MTDSRRVIEGDGVRLVLLEPAQAPQLAQTIAADPMANPWWGRDVEKIVRWMTEADVYAFRIERDGATAGMIEFTEHNDPDYRYASIDIALFAPFVGMGLGPRAISALLCHLFTVRGHHRATIDPNVTNTRAIRAYEKVGFKPVGVMRKVERDGDGIWRDGLLMDILAEEVACS